MKKIRKISKVRFSPEVLHYARKHARQMTEYLFMIDTTTTYGNYSYKMPLTLTYTMPTVQSKVIDICPNCLTISDCVQDTQQIADDPKVLHWCSTCGKHFYSSYAERTRIQMKLANPDLSVAKVHNMPIAFSLKSASEKLEQAGFTFYECETCNTHLSIKERPRGWSFTRLCWVLGIIAGKCPTCKEVEKAFAFLEKKTQ